MTVSKALKETAIWVALALLFNAGVWMFMGHQKGLEFFTGYVIELSLSVDNLFVFLLIFSYFKVPMAEQHRILFWGILGAQLMRLIFIIAGIGLLNKFSWIIYIFGAFLVFTGIKLFAEKGEKEDPADNPVIKLCTKWFPHLSRFWMVLIAVEITDLIFAVDSIPAVLAITKDPFIVYSSNIFAIIGLRSMYFALAGVMGLFHYLHYGLGVVLVFVGLKMLSEHFIHVPIAVALGFIVLTLGASIAASILFPHKK